MVLLAKRTRDIHNLIKLVSAGYTEGFYHKPRIDKDLLAQHAKGLIGLSSCLKGKSQKAWRASSKRRRWLPQQRIATFWVQGTSSSKCNGTGSRSSGSSTAEYRDRQRSRAAPRLHQRRALPA